MRKLISWSLKASLVIIIIGGGIVFWKWNDIKRLLAVNSLFSEEKIIANFSNMDALFFNTPLDLTAVNPVPFPVQAQEMPDLVDSWVTDRSLTALVVLKDGNLVHEDYFLGTSENDRRISWSVAKSFLSALFGIVLNEGAIESIDDPVTKYVPELIGTAYEGASIRNVLNMASGVTFNEDYLDFSSDINKMGRVLAMGGSMDKFAASLQGRDRSPGVAWQYVSIDTHVIGMVIRGATGRAIPDLIVDKLLNPLGLEADPFYVTDGDGVAFVLGGLNLRTRDYARFGQMYAQMGEWNGQQIVPADWVAQSTTHSAPQSEGYGFQWWLAADATEGEYFARGVYGQYIYINQPENVVIAINSADRSFTLDGSYEQHLAAFRSITAHLR